jgi:hypothetical protein
MIKLNTTIVPTTATPTRTGSASADGRIPAAWAAMRCPPPRLAVCSAGSGSISVPMRVPCGVANP